MTEELWDDEHILPKAKRGSPERDAQRAVVAWLRRCGCIVQASFTEQKGEGTKEQRMRFGVARKASGATTGWPDLTIVTPKGEIAFIEMKSDKGRLSPAQQMMLDEFTRRQIVAVVGRDIWSVEAALAQRGIHLSRMSKLQAPVPVQSLRGAL